MTYAIEMDTGYYRYIFSYDLFIQQCLEEEGFILPVENKRTSFGFLKDGTIVAIDYGS